MKKILLLLLILPLLYGCHNLNNKDELTKIKTHLNDTKKITIEDTFFEERQIYTIKDEEEIKEIITNLKNITIEEDESVDFAKEYRYIIKLYDSKDKEISELTLSPAPIKFRGFNKYTKYDDNYLNIYNVIEKNYSAKFNEISSKIMKKLENTKEIRVRDWSSKELLKTIKDEKEIKDIINLIGNSKVWEGLTTYVGLNYILEFVNEQDKVEVIVETGQNTFIKWEDETYYLTGFNYSKDR